jgi:hypothetical protein
MNLCDVLFRLNLLQFTFFVLLKTVHKYKALKCRFSTSLDRSRSSSASVVTTGRTTGVQFPAGAITGFFSLRHRVQTSSGAQPASIQQIQEDFTPEVKRPGREADHSPPSSAEVKNAWSYTSTSPYVFMT